MKLIVLMPFLFGFFLAFSQNLPINFESDISTSDFVDFDGGTATVLNNPSSSGINLSEKVARIVRDGGQIWAGSKIELDAILDFTSFNAIRMKVYTTAPVGTTVKFKLEGNGATERDVTTTVSGAWEELKWDFTGEPNSFNTLVFMFDFGNVGDGTATSTFYFDDIEMQFDGNQIDLPVDFEGTTVNYTVTDFGGNLSMLTTDPSDATNHVIQVIKTNQAATWAGTTIGTPAGFATDIPLSLEESKMSVRVWSPESNTPVRLKVEDSNDPTHTCETETNTSVAGDWEVLEFDFANEAPGTAALSFGLMNGWTYNMASIFFNFGTDGTTAGEKTYYFDDVVFGEFVASVNNLDEFEVAVYPNPTNQNWNVESKGGIIDFMEVFSPQGTCIDLIQVNGQRATISTENYLSGMYLIRITKSNSSVTKLLIKK